MSVSLSTMAQTDMAKAIDEFTDGKEAAGYITTDNYQSAYNDKCGGTSYYREYGFSIEAKSGRLENLRKAFYANRASAYNVMIKKAGVRLDKNDKVGYGAESENTVTFGSYVDRNYILIYVRDATYPSWRTCYALVWYERPGEPRTVDGSLHVIYSPDPAMKEDDDVFSDLSKSIDDYKSAVQGAENGGLVTTPDAFMQRFGTLRSLFLDAVRNHGETSYKTSIVNKIVSLCKNSGKLLLESERNVCMTGLRNMMNVCDDEYLSGLLAIAHKSLKF